MKTPPTNLQQTAIKENDAWIKRGVAVRDIRNEDEKVTGNEAWTGQRARWELKTKISQRRVGVVEREIVSRRVGNRR